MLAILSMSLAVKLEPLGRHSPLANSSSALPARIRQRKQLIVGTAAPKIGCSSVAPRDGSQPSKTLYPLRRSKLNRSESLSPLPLADDKPLKQAPKESAPRRQIKAIVRTRPLPQ
jgi:hypothetical protein